VAWSDRPQASRLLAEMAAAGRGFDAVVVGEYERAFAGPQLAQLTPVLRRYGVALWLPETYGPVDFDSPRQLALLDLLGVRSQREVSRARFRTKPPYGYRPVDAGPHPNRVHAGWGRRLHRLDPDPVTAPQVRWIFGQRLAGRSVAGIARALNERGVPCPSKADPDRNQHRSGEAWQVTTVAAILSNPRYTGRQVWNRQPANRGSPDRPDVPIPGLEARSRATSAQWAISRQVVHPALVTEEQFVRVQAVHSRRLLPGLTDAAGVAAALQANGMVIVCDHDAWAVESAVIRIDMAPVSDLGSAVPCAAGPERPGP
jgi:site-specific DNA recombinase